METLISAQPATGAVAGDVANLLRRTSWDAVSFYPRPTRQSRRSRVDQEFATRRYRIARVSLPDDRTARFVVWVDQVAPERWGAMRPRFVPWPAARMDEWRPGPSPTGPTLSSGWSDSLTERGWTPGDDSTRQGRRFRGEVAG